jgi:hypothetical protein
LFVTMSPSALTMKPDPTPVDGTENGEKPDAPLLVIVTTEGFTKLATRTIASDSVRVTCCTAVVWPTAVLGAAAGFAVRLTAAYVPIAENEAERRATATSTGPSRLGPPLDLAVDGGTAGDGGAVAHSW